MGAEGMVGIAGKKLFGGAEPPPEVKGQLVSAIQQHIDIRKVAGWGLVDDVIDPRDTRRVLHQALRMCWDRKLERPYRKRGIIPV
jgi:acetyl-CoA carboxylase carboxyltransferase component